MLNFIMVFLATLAADFCWTKYNMHSAAKHPHRAAMWSGLIVAFGAVSFLSYVNDHKLTVAAIAGAYVGTWLAVWRELKKDQKLPAEGFKEFESIAAACDHIDKRNAKIAQDHVDMFAVASHWAKDPAIPYLYCACRVCKAARDVQT
jgi:hypothetical protein